MGDAQLRRAAEMSGETLPITAVCIVADKNKAPQGFQTIGRTHDDGSDADLWRESSFSLWSRPVRYVAISRETPATIKGAGVSVITDIMIVRDSDPIPHGFVAIDYTSDSREKALRKRFLCVKMEPRANVTDAVGEVIVLNKNKKTPKDFTQAGEVDGVLICFKVVVIPSSFGLPKGELASSHSFAGLPSVATPSAVPGAPPPIGLYPHLAGAGGGGHSSSTGALLPPQPAHVNAFTIKAGSGVGSTAEWRQSTRDNIALQLHPSLAANTQQCCALPPLPSFDISRLDSDEFTYRFQLERATLA